MYESSECFLPAICSGRVESVALTGVAETASADEDCLGGVEGNVVMIDGGCLTGVDVGVWSGCSETTECATDELSSPFGDERAESAAANDADPFVVGAAADENELRVGRDGYWKNDAQGSVQCLEGVWIE